MGPRPRLHRAPLELDRLRLVGRVSRGDPDAAERRLDRHLRAQLSDGTRRLVARASRDASLLPDFAGPALRPGDRSGPLDPCTGPVGRDPAGRPYRPSKPDIWLRIVQPSIPQTMKWEPAAARTKFPAPPRPQRRPGRRRKLAAVVWPEAATPFLLERDAPHRREIAAVASGRGYVITGAVRANPPPGPVVQVWNSIEAVDGDGDIVARYDKAHLVPFGEYVPFREILPLQKITAGSLDYTAGPGPQNDRAAGASPLRPADLLRGHISRARSSTNSDRPAWILNVTNDAWYGRSSGPYQHFAIARTRAVEEGLPLVRVANNGVSGVVDAAGGSSRASISIRSVMPISRCPRTRRRQRSMPAAAIGSCWRCCSSALFRLRFGCADGPRRSSKASNGSLQLSR